MTAHVAAVLVGPVCKSVGEARFGRPRDDAIDAAGPQVIQRGPQIGRDRQLHILRAQALDQFLLHSLCRLEDEHIPRRPGCVVAHVSQKVVQQLVARNWFG